MLTSVLWFNLKHLTPGDALTYGAVLQTGRLFGAELGLAFTQTFLRMREQTYSNLIGLQCHRGIGSDQPAAGGLRAFGIGAFGWSDRSKRPRVRPARPLSAE